MKKLILILALSFLAGNVYADTNCGADSTFISDNSTDGSSVKGKGGILTN